MKQDQNGSLYMNMIFGSLGIILIFLGLLKFLEVEANSSGFILVILGLTITVHYIYHLEKKAGISDKIIWIRALFLILILGSVYYFIA
ncbi:hypothetical protein AWH56_020410 [Anaerobacillus isosaccharinicus]|uniref:Uncharacterized protein n=1 Tax=Anaerobacillus isosaccharinicus TaxID=1532552 RepID=A0A1S2KY48_9BACI|nr:hypothetical protein [Anaerobacillus isosaccharinicus]MBA5586729.1 hypothetical protein [Anaerobacillus isosaccharinicus]QOY35049.1 hypothetical protein AWH56_020410 [Anaerobacillus isosaccharinicus]